VPAACPALGKAREAGVDIIDQCGIGRAAQTKEEIFLDGQVREDAAALRDVADAFAGDAMRGQAGEVIALVGDLAALRGRSPRIARKVDVLPTPLRQAAQPSRRR
jgi:hypothetical protein